MLELGKNKASSPAFFAIPAKTEMTEAGIGLRKPEQTRGLFPVPALQQQMLNGKAVKSRITFQVISVSWFQVQTPFRNPLQPRGARLPLAPIPGARGTFFRSVSRFNKPKNS
jgi:hypothetical protein